MNLNNVDFNKIRVFCQVIESGTYRRASEVLNVTPSALSQSISGLEHALGFPLFHRMGRKLVPTQSGLRLHQEFRAHHSGFLKALRDLTGTGGEVSGLLRIGAYLEFARSQLAPLLHEFTRDFADAQIKMTFDTPTRLHDMLEGDQLDLCFSIFPARDSRTIESRPVCREELVLVSPRNLLPDAPDFDQVMATPMIEYYFNHQPIRRWIFLHYRRRPRHVPVRIYASTAEMVLALVNEGAGIGVVPRYLLDGSERSRGVKIIRPTSARLQDHIWLLEKLTPGRSALHGAFRERLSSRFRSMAER